MMVREKIERALRKGGTWRQSGFKNQGTLLTVCTCSWRRAWGLIAFSHQESADTTWVKPYHLRWESTQQSIKVWKESSALRRACISQWHESLGLVVREIKVAQKGWDMIQQCHSSTQRGWGRRIPASVKPWLRSMTYPQNTKQLK